MTDSPPQNLLEAKLKGLLRSVDGPLGGRPVDPIDLRDAVGGAGGVIDDRGYFLVAGDDPVRSLGPALLWADREGARSLDVLAEPETAADLARRASGLGPSVTVWQIDGVELRLARPGDHRPVPEIPTDELELAPTMAEAGARPVDDHGRLVAEVAGLEVARVTRTAAEPPRLEVGVGQADRDLQQAIHGHLSPADALVRVVGIVRQHRRPGAPPHPLNRLARAGWLRACVLDDPTLLGLTSAEPIPPLRPTVNVTTGAPTAAIGVLDSGRSAVVVFSSGVDTDLVAEAVDYRLREGTDRQLMVVLAEHNRHPAILRQFAAVDDVEIVAVDEPWSRPAASP